MRPTVAVAAPAGVPVGIDLEHAGRIATRDLLAGGFSDAEQGIVTRGEADASTRVLQAWCAKEAAAKCLGVGMNGRPRSFVVSAMDNSGNVQVDVGEVAVRVSLAADGPGVAYDLVEGRGWVPTEDRRGSVTDLPW